MVIVGKDSMIMFLTNKRLLICFIKDNDNIVIKRDGENETGAAYICIDCFLGFLNEAQIDPLLGSVLPGTLEETCAFFLNLPH